ncbi:DNA starvation/stationary phase protection protein [Hyphococcus flavus]|uniref:DNA starvation/stationary phase protection protein n=1 Tax=Hyphococcus flavus TaxID=1866326 RepID=A0AAE9ZAW4_9PROT|nr:DNA starvation/stationary phase protection protein [Hyphococcus flavus]WDI31059.1 DNA starvation/stationary phase protection protein [Hyphococcus flavus]
MTNEIYSARAIELGGGGGVARSDRKTLAGMLGAALASTYTLYHKTHAYHWNVTGPLFYSLHKLTDEQYLDLAEAADAIAERIRAIGFAAPVGLAGYADNDVVRDVEGTPSAGDMIAELASDHIAVAAQLRDFVEEADNTGDVYTADLLTARIGVHEEAAWMLNAMLVGHEEKK